VIEVPHEGRGIEEVDGGYAQAGWSGVGQEISLCAAVFGGGGEELTHDLVDMDAGAVDVGEVGVGRVEKKGEIGSREEDCVQAVALNEGVGDSAKGLELLLVGNTAGGEGEIYCVDRFDFYGAGSDDIDLGFHEAAEHLRFDGEASAEESDAMDAASADGLDGCVDGADQGDGRELGELDGADLLSDGGDGGDLRTG